MNAHNEQQPAAAQEAVRKPDGYHYRYPTLYGTGTCIRQNNGEEVNGSKPIEAVPYWYAPVTAAPAEFDRARETPRRQRAVELLLSMGYQWHGGEWIAASTPAAPEPSYLEYLDLQNHSLRRAIHAMMAKLVFLLDEDQFADIEAIALAAGVTPAAPGIDLTPLWRLSDEWLKAMGVRGLGNEEKRLRWALAKELRDALSLIDASHKGTTLNEQFGSAEGLESPKGGSEAPQNGEVLVTVSGLTGSGKSAVAGEIEILCKALGLEVEWTNGDEEKYLTHADWTEALELYKPRVRIVEINIPRVQAGDAEVQP